MCKDYELIIIVIVLQLGLDNLSYFLIIKIGYMIYLINCTTAD